MELEGRQEELEGRRQRRGTARRAQGAQEFLFADHPVTIFVKVGKHPGKALRIDTRNAGEFICVEDPVLIVIEFIEATRALFDNSRPDGNLSGSLFLSGKRSVTIGIPRIAVPAVGVARWMGNETSADGGNVGLSFFLGEFPVIVCIERFENLRKRAGPKGSPVSGTCGRRTGQHQCGE